MKVSVLLLLFCLLGACVSPSHFGDAHHQREKGAKLPAIQLTVLTGDDKTKEICVPTSSQTSYLQCFNYRDNTNKIIATTLANMQAFRHVNSYLLPSGSNNNLAVNKHNETTQETTQYNLVIRYHHENTDETSVRRNKFLLQMFTLFFMPMEYQVKHELNVSLYTNNTLVWQQRFVRETMELQSWYNHKLYQEAAIKSLLHEMVTTLENKHVFDVSN